MSRLIRQKELIKKVGLSASTIWRLEKKGTFPKRLKIGSYSVAWKEEDVQKWIDQLGSNKDQEG